ncbi:unnamed protein product [Paramecium primaurelia]|uniref:Uncharacterized protein n=1 Tax=Paramecium primaurelia TaxID=5886 RepID=A0A8S1KBP5_PARPR|nr:unnamed protein product [Paramecium primaurelia]
MLTQGAIEFIFQEIAIPLYVRIEKSEKLFFLHDEDCVLHICQIYDGINRRQIKIKSQYTFQLLQLQPTIQIIKLGNHDGDKCILEYRTQQQQLIPYNINQYFELNQVILFDQTKLTQFSKQPNQRINIKGRLIDKFKQKTSTIGNTYKISTIADCLSESCITIISFQNDWNGVFEHRLDQIEINQEFIFLKIISYEYCDNDRGINEIRYRIDKDTIFFPLNPIWTDYDQINYQNLGKIFNIYGCIYKIKNIQETGYQVITIVNFQKQKVNVIIKLPFAKDFKLKENTIVGFKQIKVIQKQNSHLALSFNDESQLCTQIQVEYHIDNQNHFQPPHFEIYKLKHKSYQEIQQNNQNGQYYRTIGKFKSFEILTQNEEQTCKITFDNNLIVIVKKKKYIKRLLDSITQYLNEKSRILQKEEIGLKFEVEEPLLQDFVIKVIRIENEVKYEMVKLYSCAYTYGEDEILKKVKKE